MDNFYYDADNNPWLNTQHKCLCGCRHIMRILELQNSTNLLVYENIIKNIQSIIITLYYTIDNDIIYKIITTFVFKCNLNGYIYPIEKKLVTFDTINAEWNNCKNKYNNNHNILVNSFLTYENAELLFSMYKNCSCCEKHLLKRPTDLKNCDIYIKFLNKLSNFPSMTTI